MTQELFPLLNSIIEHGYQLAPDAFKHLQTLSYDEASKAIENALERAQTMEDLFIIDKEFLVPTGPTQPKSTITTPRGLTPLASRVESKIEVIPVEEARPSGDVNGFIDYFNSRYAQVSAILKRRVDTRDAISLSTAIALPLKQKFKAIGLVTEKNARNNRIFLELEDHETSASVMVTGEEAMKKGLEILNDQVICFDGIKFRDDLLIANDLIWPDVPLHDIRKADEGVCAIIIGDVHFGSKHFRADLFEKFIRWLNLELGTPALRELASKIKYIVIVGDLVDGIGIYVNQLDELTHTTQFEQYEEAAKLLERFPDYIEIIIIPGNHDAVRRSLPQPVIPEKHAPRLYRNERVHLLPNPVTVKLHGVEFLLSHGSSLTDILSSTPGYNFQNPIKAMELLLKCRLLAPIYGASTPIAPEKTDRLVIKSIPDVFVMGHIHIHEYMKYKGITLIASGSFQAQTPFQKRMKIMPTTGVISVFNLKNHQHIPLDLEKMN